MYAFNFERPGTLAEALAALQDDEAQAIAGGASPDPDAEGRGWRARAGLVSLTGIAALRSVRPPGGVLTIGGGTPHAVVAREAEARTRRWRRWPGASAIPR